MVREKARIVNSFYGIKVRPSQIYIFLMSASTHREECSLQHIGVAFTHCPFKRTHVCPIHMNAQKGGVKGNYDPPCIIKFKKTV